MSDIELITTKEQPALSIRERVKMQDVPMTMGRIFGEVAGFMQSNGVPMAGPPFAQYHSWTNEETDLECGFPVPVKLDVKGKIRSITLPAVKAAFATHVGPYEKLVDTYTKMEQWIKSKGYQPAGCMWESYLNGPQEVHPEKFLTEIVWPIK